jgi:hypothetical protein
MNATPTTRMTTPTGVKEKKWNGSRPWEESSSATTTLGAVPISVSMPPSSEANASGISSFDGLMRARQARVTTTGSMTATVPVELMTADSMAVISMISKTSRPSPSPATRANQRPSRSATPVRNMPPETTKSAAIMITRGSPKPASAWLGVRMPLSASAAADIRATRSSRILSLTNSATVIPRMMKTVRASASTPIRLRPHVVTAVPSNRRQPERARSGPIEPRRHASVSAARARSGPIEPRKHATVSAARRCDR